MRQGARQGQSISASRIGGCLVAVRPGRDRDCDCDCRERDCDCDCAAGVGSSGHGRPTPDASSAHALREPGRGKGARARGCGRTQEGPHVAREEGEGGEGHRRARPRSSWSRASRSATRRASTPSRRSIPPSSRGGATRDEARGSPQLRVIVLGVVVGRRAARSGCRYGVRRILFDRIGLRPASWTSFNPVHHLHRGVCTMSRPHAERSWKDVRPIATSCCIVLAVLLAACGGSTRRASTPQRPDDNHGRDHGSARRAARRGGPWLGIDGRARRMRRDGEDRGERRGHARRARCPMPEAGASQRMVRGRGARDRDARARARARGAGGCRGREAAARQAPHDLGQDASGS